MNNQIDIELEHMTHIVDNYYMDADDYQYILKEVVTRTRRETNEKYQSINTVGYYDTIHGLIIGITKIDTRRKIKDGELKELNDCIDYFINFKTQIENIIKF